jgi:hypothetical protein
LLLAHQLLEMQVVLLPHLVTLLVEVVVAPLPQVERQEEFHFMAAMAKPIPAIQRHISLAMMVAAAEDVLHLAAAAMVAQV